MRKLLPPDDLQADIEKEVNAKLETGLRLTFYRVQEQEGEPIGYGMVWQYGTARKLTEQPEQFFDPDALVKDIKSWRLNVERRRERYTTVPYEDQGE